MGSTLSLNPMYDAKSSLNMSDAKSNSWFKERGQLERRGTLTWSNNANGEETTLSEFLEPITACYINVITYHRSTPESDPNSSHESLSDHF